jgi:hypothetical protein
VLLSTLCNDDSLVVYDAANAARLPLGSVNLRNGTYHGTLIGTAAPLTFGITGTPSRMVQSEGAITVTLGTPSASASTAGSASAMVWSPSTAVYDAAGNSGLSTALTELGTSDKEF